MTRYFLDTTAHLERWAGDSQRQEYVRAALGTGTHATSTHALREWRHIVEGATVDILNALRPRPKSLSDVFAQLGQGWGRTPGHRWRVVSMIAGGESAIDADLMEIRAQTYLRYAADEMFHSQIDTVRDGSECGLARNIVRYTKKGKLEYVHPATGSEWCKKTDQICRQDDDLGTKEPRLRAAGKALQASAPHKAFGDAALLAADKPPERKGKRCFQKLGDVSIALEREEPEVILTTDASFGVMAPALDLTVEQFEATPPP